MGLLELEARGITQTVNAILKGSANYQRGLDRLVEAETVIYQRDILKDLTGQKGRDPFWGVTGAAGDTLGVRSGHTRRSIVRRVFRQGGTVIGSVGSPLAQLKAHEDGRVISGNPYLRIPTAAAQTGAGVDRLAGQSARALSGGFLFKSKAGNLWIGRNEGGKLVPYYLLKRTVRLRARHVLRNVKDRNQAGTLARMSEFVKRASVEMSGGR